MAMTLVSTITVGSGGAAAIEFTGIPQTGKDLYIVLSSRSSSATTGGRVVRLRFNGNSTSYSTRSLRGSGSAAFTTSTSAAAQLNFGESPAANETANTFGSDAIYVSNYISSDNKSVSVDSVSENNATAAQQRITAGLWSQTSAITSVTLFNEDSSFVQNTTASLYIIS